VHIGRQRTLRLSPSVAPSQTATVGKVWPETQPALDAGQCHMPVHIYHAPLVKPLGISLLSAGFVVELEVDDKIFCRQVHHRACFPISGQSDDEMTSFAAPSSRSIKRRVANGRREPMSLYISYFMLTMLPYCTRDNDSSSSMKTSSASLLL